MQPDEVMINGLTQAETNATASVRGLMSKTPLSDQIERTRIELGQERTPAYGDALALCRKLEKAASTYAWPTIEDYEKDVGFKAGLPFRMGWRMARTTNEMFKDVTTAQA
jgi:hypothetical protein